MNEHKRYGKRARALYRILIVFCAIVLIAATLAGYFLSRNRPSETNGAAESGGYVEGVDDPEKVENGIHLRTGLIVSEGYRAVIENCTSCHSASLVIQNRMDAKGWEATIRWMQETQNLWPLGEKENVIINYLVQNYPVEKQGRRQPLGKIDWYPLEDAAQ